MTAKKRDILHVVLGGDNWEPTPEDMEQMAKMFMEAAVDPSGAVIVTRQGVDVELTAEYVQEGEEFNLVTVRAANQDLEQVEDPNEVVDMFPVGKIEGHRLFCAYDEEIFIDVDAEYINKYAMNNAGFYIRFGDGREDYLVSNPLVR